MISIWLDKLKLTDEDANDWEIKSKALALLLVLLLPYENAKYNGTIYRCLSPIVDLAQIFSISMVKYFHVCKISTETEWGPEFFSSSHSPQHDKWASPRD